MITYAEYIWLDGTKPTQQLRSKTRVVNINLDEFPSASDFPEWNFDGSSTSQAAGDDSDLVLKPVFVTPDPIKGQGAVLVLCEVLNEDGTPHETNTREQFRRILDAGASDQDPWVGFEQEFTLFKNGVPIGWPEDGSEPGPQGPYYCGVGPSNIAGRELVEAHADACLDAGLALYGINAEVMLGQWEFQIGVRGFEGEDLDVLRLCDELQIARWLLIRLSEEFDIHVSFDNKPIKGDWNGAGCHTNFSTTLMRDPSKGSAEIKAIIDRLGKNHEKHVAVYGDKLDERLTGLHETCSINEFRAGESDRGASIRIPLMVQRKGYGYLEDRRPGANIDPYAVCARLFCTVCDIDEVILTQQPITA